jgi:DNA-binding GntR family transcriptional regulator
MVKSIAYSANHKDNLHKSLKEQVYDYIKEKIIHCEFPPGAPLSERELAQTLNISHTPIRDAFNLLQQEKLVKIYPKQGVFVTHITFKDVQEIFTVREVIEPLATRLATPKIPEEIIKEFENIYQGSVKPLDQEEHIKLDRRFHSTIASFCDNSYIEQILTNIYDQNNRIRILSIRSDARQLEATEEHKAILDCIRRREPEQAAEAMHQHIINARATAYRVLE